MQYYNKWCVNTWANLQECVTKLKPVSLQPETFFEVWHKMNECVNALICEYVNLE